PAALAALLLALAASPAAAEDFYYHQVFNMGGRGQLSIVDFHYTTQGQCEEAVGTMRRLMLAKNPTWQQTSGACSRKLSALYLALMDNRRVNVPYFSFRDMRQWVDGVNPTAALKFCTTTAAESRFKGQGQCIH
ncbi:MAG: hypothetical protein HQL34_13755, partial [Alphaproteobacteria bacterium]|nr:hypothetical protein [Alphaproteobacteria bacterium]